MILSRSSQPFEEGFQHRLITVIDGYRIALLGYVQRQVGAHDAKADHSDICFFHFVPFANATDRPSSRHMQNIERRQAEPIRIGRRRISAAAHVNLYPIVG